MSLQYRQEPKKTPKRLLLASIVATTLFGGVSAFALSAFSLDDGAMVADRISIASSQTSLAPVEIAEMMDSSAKALMTSQIATRNAYAIKKVIDDMTYSQRDSIDPKTGEVVPAMVGAGMTSNMNCEAVANQTIRQTKNIIKDAEAYTASQRLAQLYTADPAMKQSKRISVHLDKYCDVTEVAASVCTFARGGEGSADTNYRTISGNAVLTFDGVDAGVAFIKNIIDPVDARIPGCDTDVCNAVSTVNTSYQALASSSQGAFINQMNDRMFYEYRGSKAGKEIGKNTNIVGSGGVAAPPTGTGETTPECKPTTTPPTGAAQTNPADAAGPTLPDCPPDQGATTSPVTDTTKPPATP